MLTVTSYKPIFKGYLRGTFSLKIPQWGNLIIRDLCHFQKNDNQWVSFPGRTYDENGEKKYFNYMKFEDQETMKIFQNKVLPCIDSYLNEHPELLETKTTNSKIEPFENIDDNIPF